MPTAKTGWNLPDTHLPTGYAWLLTRSFSTSERNYANGQEDFQYLFRSLAQTSGRLIPDQQGSTAGKTGYSPRARSSLGTVPDFSLRHFKCDGALEGNCTARYSSAERSTRELTQMFFR